MSPSVAGRERIPTPPIERSSLPRAVALLGAAVALVAFLTVLYDIVDTVGNPTLLYPVAAVPFVAATLLARVLRVRIAIALATLLLVVGMAIYLVSLPESPQVTPLVRSNIGLLTGYSLLQIEQADVWALGVAPAPVFVTWFLALRRRYTAAAAVAGSSVGYVVLTGDAGTTVTLLAVVAIAALVGFGDLDRTGSATGAPELVAAVLAVMVIAPLLVTVVPGGAGSPVTFAGGDSSAPTMEENVVGGEDALDIVGSIEQSPEVRFTVESSEPRYWKTGSYDRYTGEGWVRSLGEGDYTGALEGPPGLSTPLTQTVEVESQLASMPAAWRPVSVDDDIADDTVVTESGELRPGRTLESGDQYEVTSAVLQPAPRRLERAGTDYPGHIEDFYTQLPASTPNRVAEQTERITSDTDTPYESALAVEAWLQSQREYSLDVDRPDGDIADAFLFEMEAGYCTYFATTMVTMLRTQDIPARLAVGYTTGEQVDDDRWVVRGLNSHAWVEVYFPNVGWVAFDPTPGDPRTSAETTALSDARAAGEENIDTAETRELEGSETPARPEQDALHPELEAAAPTSPETAETDSSDTAVSGPQPASDEGIPVPSLPPWEQLGLAAVAFVGIAAALRRSRRATRLGSWIRYRLPGETEPATAVEQAHGQLLLVLERRHRPRRAEEPMRAYLDAVDAGPEARRLAELRERARFGDGVSRADAEEAAQLVEAVRADDSGLLGRR